MEEFIDEPIENQKIAIVSFVTGSEQLINEKKIYATCMVRGVYPDEQKATKKMNELLKGKKKSFCNEMFLVDVGKPFPICKNSHRFIEKSKIVYEENGKILQDLEDDSISDNVFKENLYKDKNDEINFIQHCNIISDLEDNIKKLIKCAKQRREELVALRQKDPDIITKSIEIIKNDPIIIEKTKDNIIEKIKKFS